MNHISRKVIITSFIINLLFFVKLDKISCTYMDTDENVQLHEAAKITSVFICIQNFLFQLPSYTNEIKVTNKLSFP